VQDAVTAQGLGEQVWVDRRSNVPLLRSWDYLYEEGVVRYGPLLRVSGVEHWGDAELVRFDRWRTAAYDRDRGSVITQTVGAFEVTFRDGRLLRFKIRTMPIRTLAIEYFRYGGVNEAAEPINKRAWPAADLILEKTAAAQLPRMRERLEAGERVEFGLLSATLHGIRAGEREFPWKRVSKPNLYVEGQPFRPGDSSSRPVQQRAGQVAITVRTREGMHDLEFPPGAIQNLRALGMLHALYSR
jgi:hypothetical protein